MMYKWLKVGDLVLTKDKAFPELSNRLGVVVAVYKKKKEYDVNITDGSKIPTLYFPNELTLIPNKKMKNINLFKLIGVYHSRMG